VALQSSGPGRRPENGPDKAAEFTGHGGDGDVAMFAMIKAPELFVEPMLGFHRDGDDLRRLPLPASLSWLDTSTF